MKDYINTLIITMVVSQIAVQLAPTAGDSKKYIRFICGLVVFICLFSPITKALKNSNELFEAVKDIFSGVGTVESSDNKYSRECAAIMSYVIETYNVDSSKIKTTVVTDEEDKEIVEIHVYISDSKTIVADKIESVLNNELGIPVYVFNVGY